VGPRPSPKGIVVIWGLSVLWTGISLSPCVLADRGIDEQIAQVTTLIEKDPDDAALFLRRGELHRIHRDWAKAEADLVKARELDPEMAAIDLCLGKLKLDAGKAAESKRALDLYLQKRPRDADAWAYRGRALVKMGRHVEAAESFTQALAHVRPDRPRPEYYFERAQALEAAGMAHLDQAVRGLDEGLQKLGDPVVLQNYAIELELKGRRYDAALVRLDRLAAGSRRKESWLVRRGEILEAAGRDEEARVAYESSLEAIASLPPSRKTNRAVTRLQEQAEAALGRLDERADAD
jgi:predicted Zn-dependent protease